MKRYRWDKKYLYWGVTALLVIIGAILFYSLLTHFTGIKKALGQMMTILSPFIWGLVISYLLSPLMGIYQRGIFEPLVRLIYKKRPGEAEKHEKLARGLAVFLTIITLLILIAALIWLIVPQIVTSIESIVSNSSDYVKTIYNWADKTLANYPQVNEIFTDLFGDVSNGLFGWIKDSVLPQINSVITNVTSGVYYVLKGVYNIIIGIIVSIYVLYNKSSFGAHMKKIVYCIFSVEAAQKILKGTKFVDTVFIGFLSGKILDSAIIALLCYVGCVFLGMPYPVLLAVIIGITNIIPFFGPIIGLVPTALIVLMISPLKCLIFIIFIIVLQQFDGNILGPKILGGSVGINGFWIMFSIIVGAGLFGFMGMLLGVPVFVVIYTGIKLLINRKLKRSGLSTDADYYQRMMFIDPATGEAVPRVRQQRRKPKNSKPLFVWLFKKKQNAAGEASGDAEKTENADKSGEKERETVPADEHNGNAEDEEVSGEPKS